MNSTPNHSSWRFVDQRKEFQGSNLRGQVYAEGGAPSADGSWLNDAERQMYERHRAKITYIVWSFYTPIAWYAEGFGWYRVGQTFSSFSTRHAHGALRNVPRHPTTMTGDRGDWTVACAKCGWTRHFSQKRGALTVHLTH